MGKLIGPQEGDRRVRTGGPPLDLRPVAAGVLAADVAKKFIELFKKRGYYDNYLYGPCHGTGLIEVEPPWMESISNYHLAKT